MEYDWDEDKASANLRKHRVDFADAALVLEDDLAFTMRDLYSEREERFVTLGRDPNGRLLVVVYTCGKNAPALSQLAKQRARNDATTRRNHEKRIRLQSS